VERYAYRIADGKLQEKEITVRPRCRWEDKIKMNLMETRWRAGTSFIWHRIGSIGSIAGAYGHGNEPSGSIKSR
jgi:hypothetical protein